ncbi:MAG: hypothetical protein JXL97_02680 [Bacteroidales bacterium]|nr:hypothetical protein [Bacteroidales bacterium]
MNNDDNFILGDIPEIFLPENEDSFKNSYCSICGAELFDDGFMVEKAFVKNEKLMKPELIFEIHVCFKCIRSLNEEMSKESIEKIEQFRKERFLNDYYEKLLENEEYKISKWLKYCTITHNKIKDCSEFNIVGFFVQDAMFYKPFPMAVSFEGMMEVEEIYSKKTKDVIDDFFDSLPPDIRKIVKDQGKVFI